MSFSVDDYYPPQWSSLPSYSYYFEIIKQGNLLGKIQIKEKQFSLIGRLQDLCDIFIDNPLVSRKHAVLQAKQNDPYLYLMDLGSQHGTFVNKVRLPAKTYKKLEPFDSIKFGVSSRVYILRCPEYQKLKEDQQNEKNNQFSKMIEEQNRKVSKQELKAKYLDMLENDPFFAASQGPRTLVGRANEPEDQYQGIDWGIDDEREVYAYKNDSDLPIQPDLLRRLNLDSLQLNKLSEYEQLLRKYQQAEGQLNQIKSKQQKQYGLEEKLQSRKQKLQKKFVEALESVQKCQDWLRVNIFGQVVESNKNNIFRQRENDTYGDDVFLDRTLEKNEAKQVEKQQFFQAESYWALQSKLKSEIQQLNTINDRLTQLENQQKAKEVSEQQEFEEDQLDLYMKQNKIDADQSNLQILKREQQRFQQSIRQVREKLQSIVGQQQIAKLIKGLDSSKTKTLKQAYLQKSLHENSEQMKKKMEYHKNIEEILNKIQSQHKNDEQIDENDVQIFKYYKEVNAPEQDVSLDEEKDLERLRNQRQQLYDPSIYEKPSYRVRKINDQSVIKLRKENIEKNDDFEEEVVDLTRQFK